MVAYYFIIWIYVRFAGTAPENDVTGLGMGVTIGMGPGRHATHLCGQN